MQIRELVVVLVEVGGRHQESEVRLIANLIRRLLPDGAQTLDLARLRTGRLHHIGIGQHAREDAVEELLLAIARHALNEMIAQLRADLLEHLAQKRHLHVARKLPEHEVARRLPLFPELLERSRVELRVDHDVLGLQKTLVDLELALRVLALGHLDALLQQLRKLETRDVELVADARLHVDQPLLEELIARGGHDQNLVEDFAAVGGLNIRICHN